MNLRALVLGLCLALLAGGSAHAQEQINSFDVAIEVETDGDILVTERIDVTAQGRQILRGIFRDLPRFYRRDGRQYRYDYDVLEVTRDGAAEPYELSNQGNARRIRIGDADAFLDHGRHVYEIRYRAGDQVRYFEDYDEVYWNATGNYWSFPIGSASARVVLPDGADVMQTAAYTGPLGATGTDYAYRSEGETHVFETTRPLAAGEGLTVAVGFAKGLIDPPSAADLSGLWWQRNGAIVILIASFGGLFWFYRRAFVRAGRDPVKGPVFARYVPPEGYSPAAVHHIYYRGLRGHNALIATLMNLAIKDRLKIEAPDKKTTELIRQSGGAADASLKPEDRALEAALFAGGAQKTIGKKYDPAFTTAYQGFQRAVGRAYGRPYFRWNLGYAILAIPLSVIAVAIAVRQSTDWTLWHTLGVLALAGLNLWFMYLLPAPTRKGQDVRTEIEGFRLYLATAEKLQMNAVKVGSDAPPPMTVERYEAFLPYAIALGVEEPWTKHFEKMLPQEAESYSPRWTSTGVGRGGVRGLNQALVASMASGVSSALPQSSGSSGSGGGGSSGGGGGGGGGGGW